MIVMDEYIVTIAGIEHTVQMPEAEAEAAGLQRKSSPARANKARKPANKASGDHTDDA